MWVPRSVKAVSRRAEAPQMKSDINAISIILPGTFELALASVISRDLEYLRFASVAMLFGPPTPKR
jgi:hypothetical protein